MPAANGVSAFWRDSEMAAVREMRCLRGRARVVGGGIAKPQPSTASRRGLLSSTGFRAPLEPSFAAGRGAGEEGGSVWRGSRAAQIHAGMAARDGTEYGYCGVCGDA